MSPGNDRRTSETLAHSYLSLPTRTVDQHLNLPLNRNQNNIPELTESPFFSSIDIVGLRVILAEPSVAPTVLKVTPSFVQEMDMESPN